MTHESGKARAVEFLKLDPASVDPAALDGLGALVCEMFHRGVGFGLGVVMGTCQLTIASVAQDAAEKGNPPSLPLF